MEKIVVEFLIYLKLIETELTAGITCHLGQLSYASFLSIVIVRDDKFLPFQFFEFVVVRVLLKLNQLFINCKRSSATL